MNLFALATFVSFIIYTYLGVYALFINIRSRLNRIFFFFCLSMGLWAFCITFTLAAPDKAAAELWHKLSSPGWCLVNGVVLHFALVLTGKDILQKKWWVFPSIYLPGVIFTCKSMTGLLVASDFVLRYYGWDTVEPVNSVWNNAVTIYYIVYLAVSVAIIMHWGKKSRLNREKKQDRVISSTLVIGIVAVFLNQTLLPAMNIFVIPRIPSMIGLIWATGMLYAIAKYRQMSIAPRIATDEIIANIMDLLVLATPRGNIVKVNQRVEELLDYRADQLIDQPIRLIFMEDGLIEGKILMMDELSQSHFRTELNLRKCDGSAIPVNISANLIKDRENDMVGFVIVAQDLRQTRRLQLEIDERRKTEEKLLRSNEKLKELDQLKTNFLSTVSHELRTPLTSILGFANIIRKRFDEVILPALPDSNKKIVRAVRQVQDNMDIIISEGERLTALINDVLDIAKMEAGKVEWKSEPFLPDEVFGRAATATAALIHQKGLRLVMDIAEKLPPVKGDPDKITQVIINLISNAVKFTSEGTVTCRSKVTENEITLSVIDTGIGIPQEDQETIFGKFKQIGDTLTDKPQGTGLGLAICKEIVEYHGGRIWVESNAGAGSIFSFTLPVTGKPG